jgi:hypothetical protein
LAFRSRTESEAWAADIGEILACYAVAMVLRVDVEMSRCGFMILIRHGNSQGSGL